MTPAAPDARRGRGPVLQGRLAAATALVRVAVASLALPGSLAPDTNEDQLRGVRVVTAENEVVRLYSGSYALLVGNSRYEHWPPLRWPVHDVEELAAVLRGLGFQTSVHKDLSAMAFREVMARFIEDHGKDAEAQLLFYYAGHGHTEVGAGGQRLGYLALTDTPDPRQEPAGFRARAIPLDAFTNYAYQITARHVLFVFDSCFAGSVARATITPRTLTRYVSRPVREFLAAGDADEPVPDRSFFKIVLAQVLEGVIEEPIPDGYLTGEELGILMKTVIPSVSAAQHPRHSKINDPALDKGDFVFVLNKAAAPPPRVGTTPPEVPYRYQKALWQAKEHYTRSVYPRALQAFAEAAGQGSSEAMTFLGYMYFRGLGAPPDAEAARRWFEEGAKRGNTSAMNNLGFMYGPGGVPPLDVDKARSWLGRAVELGDICAAYNLGMLYLREGVQGWDRKRGKDLLKQAAEGGYGEAMNNLAYFLAAENDATEAVRWYEEAIRAGETSALANLGHLYYEGKLVPRDFGRARELFTRAANAGHDGAMNSLGWMDMNGDGAGRNYQTAAGWFEKAANAGNAAAANNLGTLYEGGKGVKRDVRSALEWYTRSANHGNAGGLVNLGRFYEEGIVVGRDRKTAMRLYEEAAALGEPQGKKKLLQLQGQH